MTELDVQLSRTVAAAVITRHDRRNAWATVGTRLGAWSLLLVSGATLLVR